MKLTYTGIIALVLLFGCTMPETEQIEEELEAELQNISITEPDEHILLSGNDTHSIVIIKAVEVDGRWQFPIEDYEDEFIFAGLHSDSFIKLNNSHIGWLEDEEAIWLTPMIRNGDERVLFNAIYSNGLECNVSVAPILGKNYVLSQLKNDSGFENDDKWKVALEYEGGCLKRIVIYSDGYFYDIRDGEEISLFRNDNTIVLRFGEDDSTPYAEVIATKLD